MRQDPDIILVGETRDKETAQTAMEAALTGHMVSTTLPQTIPLLLLLDSMKWASPYLVGSSVIGVMAQRLVRKVCTSCATTKQVSSEDILASKYKLNKIKIPQLMKTQDKMKICAQFVTVVVTKVGLACMKF